MTKTILPTLLLTALLAAPLVAQDSGAQSVDRRVEKLERELRAVQRQVFPGGAGAGAQVLQPEITPQPPSGAPGNPAASPTAVLTARVNALEAQLATLTGQGEEAQNRLRQLEQRVEQLTQELARRPVPAPVAPPRLTTPDADAEGEDDATDEAAETAADPDRAARVAAIARPSTGDAVEDGYIHGYRLWEAGFHPEAQAALKAVADANPGHRRYSYAQNLLGRAYLDDGKPGTAAIAFLDNYETMPGGERAPDSLYYLGLALVADNNRTRACEAFAEYREAFGASGRADLTAQVDAARTRARCG